MSVFPETPGEYRLVVRPDGSRDVVRPTDDAVWKGGRWEVPDPIAWPHLVEVVVNAVDVTDARASVALALDCARRHGCLPDGFEIRSTSAL